MTKVSSFVKNATILVKLVRYHTQIALLVILLQGQTEKINPNYINNVRAKTVILNRETFLAIHAIKVALPV